MIDWTPVQAPAARELTGRHVTLRPVVMEDAEPLFEAGRDPAIWTYLPYGPFETVEAMRGRVAEMIEATDTLYLVASVDGVPQGIVSYLRIDPEHGSIEIGHIWFGTPLQRTTAATEAIFLLATHAMDDLGYRRFEWKCNALNEKSRRAAERFGFTFEGIFRNHMVVKGQNRDTAWYSITDYEWPAIRAAFEDWLAPENFDEQGLQRKALRAKLE
ncbi:MAG TPA: GNAT family protein [Thermoleophilaceae bacterium]